MVCPYRTWIAVMVFLTAFTYYTTRVNLSVSIVSMTKGKTKGIPYCKQILLDKENRNAENVLPDYGPRYDWNERVQGQVLGSYFYGYVFFNLFSGAISEYFGPFKVILIVHFIAAIVNAFSVIAAQIHFGVLMICRFLLGCGGALVFPALQMLIAHWAPPNEKGKFVSALMGNVLGTSVTLPLVGIITKNYGWNWGFYAVSIVNILFCFIFFLLVTDTPDDHRWVTEEEAQYIREQHRGTVTKKKVIAPYKDIFTNIPCLMVMTSIVANDWGLNLQLVLGPKFISDVIGYELDSAGAFSALPPISRMCFGLWFGHFADVLMSRGYISKLALRRVATVISHIIPGIMLISISFFGCDFIPVMSLLTASLGLNGAVVQNNLVNTQDLAPNFSPTIYAFASFFSGMTGFVVTALNAEITSDHNGIKEWGYTFIMGGCVYCLGGIVWILFGSVEEQSFNRKGDPQ